MSFRYDLNQIQYDYAMEVTNSFKGLDLVDRVPEGLWAEFHNILQEVVTKPSQRKAMPKNAQTTTQLHSSPMLVK